MCLQRQQLLETAQRFCDAFKSKADVNLILSFFASKDGISAFEHGEYFETVNDVLSYDDLQFSDFVVDVDSKKVALKGKGTFQWKSTKESWVEIFAYMLSFDEESRMTAYEVWADSGSAYLARIGKLDEIRRCGGV